MVEVQTSHVFLGGGVGPLIGGVNVPPWRSGSIDPTLAGSGAWAGDFLPPPPPFKRSTIGTANPAPGERVPKRVAGIQPGFQRGLLTAGGMGGWGRSAPPRHGGPAGHGGAVQITLAADARLTFREVDIATGAEIETLRHIFFLPDSDGTVPQVVCTASGAHGGLGSTNGNGGDGGNAGGFTLSGGILNPAPAQSVEVHTILGFPPGEAMQEEDDFCSRGRITVGHVVQALDAAGRPLYRVRRSVADSALLGGLVGIPSQAGVVGAVGANGLVSGLPLQ